MQQTFGGPDHVGFAAVNEAYKINAFYAELFNFFYLSWLHDSNVP